MEERQNEACVSGQSHLPARRNGQAFPLGGTFVNNPALDQALQDLLDLRIARYPHFVLLPRIWQLRDNFSAYDAAYVVLAEKLGATLITRDSRLALASGHDATIELL